MKTSLQKSYSTFALILCTKLKCFNIWFIPRPQMKIGKVRSNFKTHFGIWLFVFFICWPAVYWYQVPLPAFSAMSTIIDAQWRGGGGGLFLDNIDDISLILIHDTPPTLLITKAQVISSIYFLSLLWKKLSKQRNKIQSIGCTNPKWSQSWLWPLFCSLKNFGM